MLGDGGGGSGGGAARREESAEAVVAAARAGDERALEALRDTADWLGMGIANLISLLNPEMVVLGGGLMQAGDLLLPRIRESAVRWAQPVAMRRTAIELTRVGRGCRAAGRGAGWRCFLQGD